ncbi:epidermal growth factor receptor substrate 15-like 1 [Dermatophagoides farinae]|uniref:Epidermal growth factor receptor substrate 15-like 1 n=1 Tax=Dermatophagoides farinae TaxID=6954 RepID=A0A9D4NSN4_DERFA|nr:epidermal growth factor receptor substrate 15-like 1 [Dermatophagoides farinae]
MDSVTTHEIAGDHLQLYEKFYQQINPTNSDIINAMDAANFLRKSGLNQMTLKIIWDLSDPNGLGYLDKKSFFVSLKLIAMNDDFFKSIDWNISTENAQKFATVFNSMGPVEGKLAGTKVKPYLISSKLPVETLTKIWDLSDIDQDGFLNLKEFIVCCQLIARASQGFILPAVLPNELLNFNPADPSARSFSRTSSVSSQSCVSPHLNLNEATKSTSSNQWIVTNEEKIKSDELFIKLDKDNDGLVSGLDVKDTLLESGLPQPVLAHIWNLCDMKETGKLNAEQFALARYFIQQKQNGIELPMKLLPNMIPPTFRPKPMESISNENINGSMNLLQQQQQQMGTSPTSSTSSTGNRELDLLQEDIKKIQLEKTKYESEVIAEEQSLRLKQSEVKSIHNEIEALSQMLKQLENQKNDAKKRIDDLNTQVENLNKQYNEQKKNIDDQESDLNSKKQEFEQLKSEETVLETKIESAKKELERTTKLAADTQLEISQIKANTVELDEYERRFNETIYDYDNAISNADYANITSLLSRSITPPVLLTEEQHGKVLDSTLDEDQFNSDPFAGEDPFKDDPFGSNKTANDAFGSDNFANFDAFGTSNTANNKGDPFGFSPFDSNQSANDQFRSESPTPALPPKKSKAPPPRPAPPSKSSATNKTPLRAAPPPPSSSKDKPERPPPLYANASSNFDPFTDQNRDPFGSDSGFSSSNTQNFANFADFDKAQ